MPLRYPVLLVHGLGFHDHKRISYWGRIPKALEAMGCNVFFGNQDGNADIETNGRHLAGRIDEILEQTKAEKVNIIAHSKGGLESRYAISALGFGGKVASLTTIATPHNGSKTIDWLLRLPEVLLKLACFYIDCWFRLLGDKTPNFHRILQSFTTAQAARFNAETPDDPGVYYQSYAFVMRKASSDLLMWLPYLVVRHIEGENDGLLPPDSVKWGNFKGVIRGARRRGISHCDEVDLRRRPLSKKPGDGVLDIVDFYRELIAGLMERGF